MITVASPLILILFPLAFFMLIKGLLSLKNIRNYGKNKEEVERIFRQRVIVEEEKAISDFGAYFEKAKKSIYVSAGYFLISFMLIFISFFLMKNSEAPSSIWLVFLVILIPFLMPVSLVLIAFFDLKTMEDEILRRFKSNH